MSLVSEILEREISVKMQQIAIDLDGRIVNRTPVKTGRLRSNWVIGLGSPNRGVIQDYSDETGLLSESEAAQLGLRVAEEHAVAINRALPLEDIYISNNLPYALPIEEGGPTTTARAMVATSILETRREFQL